MLSKEEFVAVVLRYTQHKAEKGRNKEIEKMWGEYKDDDDAVFLGLMKRIHPSFYNALINEEKLLMIKAVIDALDIKEHSHSHV